jgi:hypothetical protein
MTVLARAWDAVVDLISGCESKIFEEVKDEKNNSFVSAAGAVYGWL